MPSAYPSMTRTDELFVLRIIFIELRFRPGGRQGFGLEKKVSSQSVVAKLSPSRFASSLL